MWRQRTCQEQELRARARKRKRFSPPALPEKYVQEVSPFENMPSVQVPYERKLLAEGFLDISQETFRTKPKDTMVRSVSAIPITKYKEYVGLRNSVLADNESKLLVTPYVQILAEEFTEQLAKYYEMTHDENGPLDLRKEQCRFYKNSIEAFLAEIGVSWDQILYWLLAPKQTIRRINDTSSGGDSFGATLLERSAFESEEFEREIKREVVFFDRNHKHWRELFLRLEEPTAKNLRLSALACMAILQECEFSIWYLARQSETVRTHNLKETKSGQTAPITTYRQVMCRVCHQYVHLLLVV
jgi:histone-lysine N-methyltransferase EZH2